MVARKKEIILEQECNVNLIRIIQKNTCPLLYRLTGCLVFKGLYKVYRII